MITPKEIQQQCSNWWKNVLKAYIESVDYFPKEINRIGKITTKDLMEKLPEYRKYLELLRASSKLYNKLGYSLIEIEKQFEKIGKQLVPDKIVIETLEDYLKITGKEKEYQVFTKNCELLLGELPKLKEWMILNPQKLVEYDNWINIIKVCNFFIKTPKPNLYTRELPIQVPTKFIEKNEKIIKELTFRLIGEHIQLKYPEPLIRFRILDKQVSQENFSGINDISIPISQFEQLKLPLRNVFVVENKTNLLTIALTLPEIEEAIVIFGSGYKVENLRNVEWLKQVNLFYWGDLDAQGFEILSQFRGYFEHTKSFLMNKETFDKFFENDSGTPSKATVKNLTDDEKQIYELLKYKNWRLEQEKIPLEYVKEYIERELFNSSALLSI